MLHLIATLHTVGVTALHRAHTKLTTDTERGSETMDKVIWAVAVVAIAALGVAAVRHFVEGASGNIKP